LDSINLALPMAPITNLKSLSFQSSHKLVIYFFSKLYQNGRFFQNSKQHIDPQTNHMDHFETYKHYHHLP
jgi:hypothetical protein